jgi:hypothetical protein
VEIADVLEDPTGLMRVKLNIALRKRTLSRVRFVLEGSSIHSFLLFFGWGI